MKVVARHLDASASALQRNQELRSLAHADDECRVVCNVKLFTEGVDVPQLNAVAFLDPRDSQVDVVQAVGRVMRKAPGKRFGYIIIPVVVEPGRDVAAALERGTEGYKTVGRVLRALQAHDGRLAESPASFIKVYEQIKPNAPRDPGGGTVHEPEGEHIQRELDLIEAEQGIYAHVVAASGLGKPGSWSPTRSPMRSGAQAPCSRKKIWRDRSRRLSTSSRKMTAARRGSVPSPRSCSVTLACCSAVCGMNRR